MGPLPRSRPWSSLPSPPPPDPAVSRPLTPRRLLPHLIPSSAHTAVVHCWAFLACLRVAPAFGPEAEPHLQQGTSWVELFCAFHALGGTLVEPGVPASSPREGLRLALRRFKRTLLMVVSLSLGTDERVFFRPSKSRLCRLKDIGFSNHVSCINGVACFNDRLRCHVLYGLLALRMAVTNKVKQSLNQGHLHIKPCKISYRGVPAWLKLGLLSSEVPALANLACTSGITMFSWRRTSMLWLSCGQCSIRTDVQHTTLFLRGKWATLKCGCCGTSSSARRWSCVCGVPWHGCHIHAKSGFACRKRPRRPVHSPSSSCKRDPGPSNCRPIPSLHVPLTTTPMGQPTSTSSTSANNSGFLGPSNCRPNSSLSAPVLSSALLKKRRLAAERQLHTPTASSRTATTRACKRKSPPSHASDLEAVARLRDARSNPVPEHNQIPPPRRENSRGDATPPCGLHIYRDPG